MTDSNGRAEAVKIARFWIDNGFAIAWTGTNVGDAAKDVTHKGWKEIPPLEGELENVAGQVAERLKRRNPAVVLRQSNLVGVECDSEEDVKRLVSFGLPETLTVRSSEEWKQHFYFRAHAPSLDFVAFRFEEGKLTADKDRCFITPPAIHPSGVPYSYVNGSQIATLPRDIYERLVKEAGASRREQNQIAADPDKKITAGGPHETH